MLWQDNHFVLCQMPSPLRIVEPNHDGCYGLMLAEAHWAVLASSGLSQNRQHAVTYWPGSICTDLRAEKLTDDSGISKHQKNDPKLLFQTSGTMIFGNAPYMVNTTYGQHHLCLWIIHFTGFSAGHPAATEPADPLHPTIFHPFPRCTKGPTESSSRRFVKLTLRLMLAAQPMASSFPPGRANCSAEPNL